MKYLELTRHLLCITFTLGLGFISSAEAAKEFSLKETSSFEDSASYSIERKTKTASFQGKTSEIVSNEELVQRATRKLLNDLREGALDRLLVRCAKEFGDCRENEVKVVKVENEGVRAQAVQSSSGLRMEIEKKVKVSATVNVSVVGYTPTKKGDGSHEVTVDEIVYEELKGTQNKIKTMVKLRELKEKPIQASSRTGRGNKAKVLPMKVKRAKP